jgi:hypothetical protein
MAWQVRPAGTVHRRAVLVVMCVGLFLVQLDVTVVNVALPRIATDLAAGVAGSPAATDRFLTGLHHDGLLGVLAYGVAALALVLTHRHRSSATVVDRCCCQIGRGAGSARSRRGAMIDPRGWQ